MLERSGHIDRATFLKRAGALFGVALIDRSSLRRLAIDSGSELHHPDPRPGINADHVLTPADIGDRVTKRKNTLAAYDAARERPELFDSIACGCGCSMMKPAEHRSLLVCYETQQPTGCLSCQEEALFVDKMAKDNKTLAEIRAAVDKKFG